MRVFKNKMFQKWSKSENLSDASLLKTVNEISKGLIDVYLGGCLIKQRIARQGQGKSGGYRTLLVFQKGYRTFFIYGFTKSQRANINKCEEKALKKLAQALLNASDNEITNMLINKDLYEVKT